MPEGLQNVANPTLPRLSLTGPPCTPYSPQEYNSEYLMAVLFSSKADVLSQWAAPNFEQDIPIFTLKNNQITKKIQNWLNWLTHRCACALQKNCGEKEILIFLLKLRQH